MRPRQPLSPRGQGPRVRVAVVVPAEVPPCRPGPLGVHEQPPLNLGLHQGPQAAEVDLALLSPRLELRPGGRAEIAVRLRNATAAQIRGEAQLGSPFGSWAQARPWTRGFTAGPDRDVTLSFTVTAPAAARPGQHWWALVKVMYFGRVRYSEPAAVTITDAGR